VSLPFKQAEALLYYLLVEGEVSRAKVADIIWGDRGDEKKIRSSMRNAIYVLRKAFGYDFLQESQKNVIGIHPDCRVDLDISRLTDPRGELQGYPGDFLEDFHLKDNEYYNDWVQTTRQRFNRICLERLKQEMTRAFDREDWERCEAICLRLLELDEFDESIYCSLMEVYRLRGEYSKATALYAQLQKLFAEELFQAPGQEATRLMESIKDLRNQKVTEIIAQKSQPEQKVQGELFYGRIEELERDGFLENVPGKGCFVAAQDPALLRESQMHQVEALLAQAVREARTGGFSLQELHETLDILYHEDEL